MSDNNEPGYIQQGMDKAKDVAGSIKDGAKYAAEITADTFRGMRQDAARVVEVGREASMKTGNALDAPLTDQTPGKYTTAEP